MSHFDIALAADEKYFPGLLVTVVSTVIAAPADAKLVFHVLDGGIADSSWTRLCQSVSAYNRHAQIKRVIVDETQFANFPRLFGSLLTYARLLLPNMLPDVNCILYLDADILITKDVTRIWELRSEGQPVLAVPDQIHWQLKSDCPWLPAHSPGLELPYFNAGFMLMALDVWRRDSIHTQVLDLVRNQPELCTYADQTPLNYFLRGNVSLLELSWNRRPDKLEPDPATGLLCENVHYMAFKPWLTYINAPGYAYWYAFYDLFCAKRWPAVIECHLQHTWAKRSLMGIAAHNQMLRFALDRLASSLNLTWNPELHDMRSGERDALRGQVSHWRRLRKSCA